jgi:hypothetical protein
VWLPELKKRGCIHLTFLVLDFSLLTCDHILAGSVKHCEAGNWKLAVGSRSFEFKLYPDYLEP